MRIKLIAEGSTGKQRKALRWGISWVAGDVLFDTFGRADLFWKNIKRFKVDLSGVRHVVISHDDWDHVAGLEGFLQWRSGVKVWVCKRAGRGLKNIVIKNGGELIEVAKAQRISSNLYSLGQMRADTGRGILYEQALVVRSHKGFSVITGCAHPGIVKIIKQAISIFGKKMNAVCGGFHMKDNSEEMNEAIVCELLSLGVQEVIPLHCSGKIAFNSFKKQYKKHCLKMCAGDAFTL